MALCSCTSIQGYLKARKEQQHKEHFQLYLLAGQSNMAGRGKITSYDTLTSTKVKVLGKDSLWYVAKHPLHYDKPRFTGVGPGLSFALKIVEYHNEDSIGLVPAAVGGTSIKDWQKNKVYENLNVKPYNDAVERAKKAIASGSFKGVVWHQGENDCKDPAFLKAYPRYFYHFLDSLKADLKVEQLPVVIGELGHFFYQKRPLAKTLNDTLRRLAERDPCIAIAASDSLVDKGDKVHFNSESYRILGERYAKTMYILQQTCPVKHRQ
jgi:hypothetical protein